MSPHTSLSLPLLISSYSVSLFFFFNDTATTEIYTLSLHDALPILTASREALTSPCEMRRRRAPASHGEDRKSTRLNSSHMSISYAVFCLKKKKKTDNTAMITDRYAQPETECVKTQW